MTRTVSSDSMRVTVGGDPEGGWLVDIHDGTEWGVYHPEAADAETAKAAALKAHCEAYPYQIVEPIEPVVALVSPIPPIPAPGEILASSAAAAPPAV